MIDYLNTHITYWHWIVLGIFLAAGEMFAPSFIMLLLGVAAIFVGIISYAVELPFSTQLIFWLILSGINTIAWFKFVMPRIKTKSLSGMAREEAVGAIGMVVSFDQVQQKGRVRFTVPLLGQSEWSIISNDILEAGDTVRVTGISGNALIVDKK